MADEKLPQFAEDDDLARAKAFWKDNGKSIVFGIVLGLGGIAGFNYWQSYQQHQGESASALFDQMRPGIDAIGGLAIGQDLKDNFASSVYASLGALMLAKIFVEEGKYDVAEEELQWVLDNSPDPGIIHIARMRLGTVFLAMNQPQKVLDLLNNIDMGSFAGRYHELRGDAFAMRGNDGDVKMAREAYRNSIEILNSQSEPTDLIQLKLDNTTES